MSGDANPHRPIAGRRAAFFLIVCGLILNPPNSERYAGIEPTYSVWKTDAVTSMAHTPDTLLMTSELSDHPGPTTRRSNHAAVVSPVSGVI